MGLSDPMPPFMYENWFSIIIAPSIISFVFQREGVLIKRIYAFLFTGLIMDVEEIQRLLESVEVESDLDTSDDENVTDNVEQQLESSDTKQDVSSDECNSEDVSSGPIHWERS